MNHGMTMTFLNKLKMLPELRPLAGRSALTLFGKHSFVVLGEDVTLG
jgi:hypothetical protein